MVGHEGKCRHLHGHNYRFHFEVGAPSTNHLGMVVDFSIIKSKLCQWLEDEWDHRFLVWEEDPLKDQIKSVDSSTVVVPFNPTAENIARHMVETVGPSVFDGSVWLVSCRVDETRKCSATYSIGVN